MTNIQYLVHSTTVDNEKKRVSGWYDCPLSSLGREQAQNLFEQFPKTEIGNLYTSPLTRAQQTANSVFPEMKINEDERLKEIHYGKSTHQSKNHIDSIRHLHIDTPFDDGESYHDVEQRMRSFLYDCRHLPLITIISHQAPQLALEVICNNVSWEEAFIKDWRLHSNGWKPFWLYEFDV